MAISACAECVMEYALFRTSKGVCFFGGFFIAQKYTTTPDKQSGVVHLYGEIHLIAIRRISKIENGNEASRNEKKVTASVIVFVGSANKGAQ